MDQITLTSTSPSAPYVAAPVGVGPALAVAITAAEKAISKLDRRQETACKENNRARDLSALFGFAAALAALVQPVLAGSWGGWRVIAAVVGLAGGVAGLAGQFLVRREADHTKRDGGSFQLRWMRTEAAKRWLQGQLAFAVAGCGEYDTTDRKAAALLLAAIQRAEDGARSYSLASFPVLDAKASE